MAITMPLRTQTARTCAAAGCAKAQLNWLAGIASRRQRTEREAHPNGSGQDPIIDLAVPGCLRRLLLRSSSLRDLALDVRVAEDQPGGMGVMTGTLMAVAFAHRALDVERYVTRSRLLNPAFAWRARLPCPRRLLGFA
jgi:hypothetical protein